MGEDKLLYSGLTYQIRGAIFQVYNTLGYGHKEKVYHKALAIEFGNFGLEFKDETPIDVVYQGQKIGKYQPDFVVEDKVIIEIKSVPFLAKDAERQMVYYLKGTEYNLGLLVNFGTKKLDIKRKVWTNNPRKSAQKSAKIKN